MENLLLHLGHLDNLKHCNLLNLGLLGSHNHHHLLHFGNFLCASCMPSALHSLPSASCHWPCVVLWGFTFFLSQTVVLFLWHGLNMCCCPLVFSVAAICCTLATCCVPHACPLPSTLCPLPHVTCLVWSCGVLPSFCLLHLFCLCGIV